MMNKPTEASHSVADEMEDLIKCPRCGATTQFDHGTCINCFLREGIEAKGEGSRETFESILLEANVTDTQWRLGHYEILEEIGRGGMGVIYRARQQHSRRIVAVKRMLSHQVNSHETLVRFRREAEAVASLDHPNILPIHEVSESEEGLPFFSMKYATGGSLRAAAPTLRTDPRKCVRLMAKVARAIAYAHGKGVLHRDLQPGNILLDENGEPMVSDFGLAKWLDQNSDLTRTLETLGTPGYIAPEQTECPADKLTFGADIYSLGAILFYLLTGRPPFVGPNVLYVIHQAAATPAPRLRSLAPSLDRDLETIVARCLESDPNARYQSAGAFAEDLEHWLRHEPIRARRAGVLTRGRKWVRRNPTTTALVAALVALAAAIVGVIVWKSELPHSISPVLPTGVAVLPFENLSADPENAFFTDGVQDEILNDLAKIADLKVISRTSAMQYKSGAKRNLRQIANELGVAHVVEGSVQRAANRVRVSAQLIDAKTDTHLWSESYDRPLDDVFVIQSDIAKAIAAQLQAKLSPSQSSTFAAAPTRDAEAHDLFLKGEYQERQAESTYKEETYDSAETFYRQALARDPTFSLAYARLAYNRLNRHWFVKRLTSGQLDEVKSDIERAIAIAPDLPDAHLALGLFHYWGRHDFDSALKEFDRAVELQPSNSVSRSYRAAIYRRRGEWRRSLAEYERAAELDPRDVWIPDQIGGGYLGLRRWSDAERWLKHALALDPHHLGAAFRLNLTYIASTGDIQRARRAWEGIPNERGAGQGVRPYYIVIPEMIDERVYLYVLERHFSEALQEWDIAPGNTAEGRLAQLKARIGIQVLAGQSAAAKPECEEARVLLEAELAKRQPEDRVWVSELAWIYVCLGRNADALRIAREAAETMPIEKDAILGINFLVGLAQIEAHAGQSEEAVKILRQLLTIPAGEYISVARLKIDPVWDPIRNDPGFQKLLSEPEPETVYK
jgi:TolB-like protein/tRNA A-37 threonylcarbamoyl transferase component Bud32/Flp pilus assembly protein TadD